MTAGVIFIFFCMIWIIFWRVLNLLHELKFTYIKKNYSVIIRILSLLEFRDMAHGQNLFTYWLTQRWRTLRFCFVVFLGNTKIFEKEIHSVFTFNLLIFNIRANSIFYFFNYFCGHIFLITDTLLKQRSSPTGRAKAVKCTSLPLKWKEICSKKIPQDKFIYEVRIQ